MEWFVYPVHPSEFNSFQFNSFVNLGWARWHDKFCGITIVHIQVFHQTLWEARNYWGWFKISRAFLSPNSNVIIVHWIIHLWLLFAFNILIMRKSNGLMYRDSVNKINRYYSRAGPHNTRIIIIYVCDIDTKSIESKWNRFISI